jgi:hypothetical protein
MEELGRLRDILEIDILGVGWAGIGLLGALDAAPV